MFWGCSRRQVTNHASRAEVTLGITKWHQACLWGLCALRWYPVAMPWTQETITSGQCPLSALRLSLCWWCGGRLIPNTSVPRVSDSCGWICHFSQHCLFWSKSPPLHFEEPTSHLTSLSESWRRNVNPAKATPKGPLTQLRGVADNAGSGVKSATGHPL